MSGDITGRQISSGPESEESIQKVRLWVQECCEGHSECGYDDVMDRKDEFRRYPSRLLDVGLPPFDKSPFYVLVDGKEAPGHYITVLLLGEKPGTADFEK